MKKRTNSQFLEVALLLVVCFFFSCKDSLDTTSAGKTVTQTGDESEISKSTKSVTVSLPFLKGVDLSYVNELEDCGVVYKENNQTADPYEIMADYGANLLRLRLWHNPTWTSYSTLDDVKRSIQRGKKSKYVHPVGFSLFRQLD